MKTKIIAILCILIVITSPITIAQTPGESTNPFTSGFEEEVGQAIVINVDGIEPTIVPASVLENQNTPVYAFLKGVTLGSLIAGEESPQISPLYGTPPIRIVSIRLADAESSRQAVIQYIPPQRRNFLSQDGFTDLGYLIIMLKRVPQETKVPDNIVLNLTADIRFDLESGFGEFGLEDLVLVEEPDEQAWKQDRSRQQKFWGGKGYIRASKIDENQVSLSLYDTRLNNIGTMFFSKTGDIKGPINLRSGFFLYDYFRVEFRGTKTPEDKITLKIIRDNNLDKRIVGVGDRIYPGSDLRIIEIKESVAIGNKDYVNEVVIRNNEGNIKNLRSIFASEAPLTGTSIDFSKSIEFYLDKIIGRSTTANSFNTYLDKIKTYDEIIKKNAQRFNVDEDLIRSVIWYESNGDSTARSSSNAIGLMQLLQSTARGVAKSLNYKSPEQLTIEEIEKPEINIELGTKYLADRIKEHGAVDLGLASYNGGDGLFTGTKNFDGLYSFVGQRKTWIEYQNFLNNNQNMKNIITTNIGPVDFNFANNILNFYNAIKLNGGQATLTETVSSIECKEDEVYQTDDLAQLNPDKKKLHCTSINELNRIVESDPNAENMDEVYFYLGKNYEELGDYSKAINEYGKINPGNSYYENALLIIDNLQDKLNRNERSEEIYLEDEDAYVSLEKVTRVETRDRATASIRVGNDPIRELKKDDVLIRNARDKNNEAYDWVVESIADTRVTIRQKYNDRFGITFNLNLKDIRQVDFDVFKDIKYEVHVTQIDTKQEAYVTILPGSGKAVSRSDFKVHIPIEKRPFSLSPQQIDHQINETRKIINDIDKIVAKLDNTIRIWTATCYGVFGLLTVKNLLQGPIHARARQLTLNGIDGESGWKQYCKANSGAKKTYVNYDSCIFENRNIINTQIEDTETNLKEFKKESEDYENQDFYKNDYSKYKTPDNADIVNKDEAMRLRLIEKELEDAKKRLGDYDSKKDEVAYSIEKNNIDKLELERETRAKFIDNKKKAVNEAYEYLAEVIKSNSGISQDELIKVFETKYKEIFDRKAVDIVAVEKTSAIFLGRYKDVRGEERTYLYYYENDGRQINLTEANKLNYKNYLEGKLSSEQNTEARTKLQKQLDALKILKDEEVVRLDDGRTLYQALDEKGNLKADKFILGHSDLSSNRIRRDYDAGAKVEYYEDGKPYCVPTRDGNFVKILEYYANGQPKTISEWNVGPDGLPCTNDDVLLTSEDVLRLPDSSTQNKANDFKTTVNRAGICRNEGDRISGLVGNWICSKARSQIESSLTQAQCSDFMDIGDCQTLFNICDPVLCPGSRFNLGGRWPLGKRSVAETGLIGSLILGLPNWGLSQPVPPVCVTGVSAGLKAWRSVFQGYAECLQVAKVEQKSVGICDKVRSVYMCELVWREALALLDVNKGVFSLGAEAIFGENNGKGGGEYLTFKDSFDNAADSFKFFTSEYGRNAFAAYKARSTEEFGTQICKAAIFGKAPGLGKFFDQLTAPDTPPQFTAFFDVFPWTTSAGRTAGGRDPGLLSQAEEQSRYQIYYHIYAGENSDVWYSVFLNDKFGRNLYVTDCNSQFKQRDIIKVVGYIDKTCDIIARSGYDQVCVSINNRVECGFGKITTGFGLSYVNDLFVKSELNRQINTAEDCRPEQQRLSPVVDIGTTLPNEGLISTGIVRVCNPTNPGTGTNPSDWNVVGSCGKNEQGQDLGLCWLDMRTVKIQDIATSKEVLRDIEERGFEVQKLNVLPQEKLKTLFDGLEKRFNELFIANGKLQLNAKLNITEISNKELKLDELTFKDVLDENTINEITNLIKYDDEKTRICRMESVI